MMLCKKLKPGKKGTVPFLPGCCLFKILFFIRCDKYGAVDAYDAIYLDLYLIGYLDTL